MREKNSVLNVKNICVTFSHFAALHQRSKGEKCEMQAAAEKSSQCNFLRFELVPKMEKMQPVMYNFWSTKYLKQDFFQ